MSKPKYTALTAEEILDEMIGKFGFPCLHKVQLETVRVELLKLRNQVVEIHTMIECVHCKRGVRPRDAVRGYCPRCAEELLDVTDKLLTERNRVLDAIPECPAHGPQCVPHAIEWIEDTQAELTRLRRIEAACMSVYNSSETTRTEAAGFWLAVSQPGVAGVALGDVGHSIADALLKS